MQAAIRHGDDITGATTFLLDEGMDTGPILGTMTELVQPSDTAGELLSRLAHAGAGLLVSTLDAIESGDVVAVPQPPEGISYAAKITVDDARISWHDPALAIDRMIRACTPTPGAWTTLGEERVKIGPVEVIDEFERIPPGHLVVGKSTVHVGTATTPVRLGLVQGVGKRQMAAADWARGLRLGSDAVLS